MTDYTVSLALLAPDNCTSPESAAAYFVGVVVEGGVPLIVTDNKTGKETKVEL